ncbi:MAG: XamI family restriction endonuclease [Betaproteobacteria bacterium]|jgi:hypothetical protein|nr:XamI family restriction endonuclease [Betaproteobacteria bacterium]
MPKATPPPLPPTNSDEQIRNDAALAREEFRQRRLGKPLAAYNDIYPVAMSSANVVVGAIDEITATRVDRTILADIVGNKQHYAALRSLAATPISADDLKTLVGATISKTALKANQDLAQKLASLIADCLDPQRFPWVHEGRAATRAELASAKLATAVLVAVSAVQAGRRGDERADLEGKVEEILIGSGYKFVAKPKGGISNPKHGPEPGHFMKTCKLGTHNADFVIGLWDGRIMAIECKASNSEVNGFKRLNKEVVVDAKDWTIRFGRDVVVPAAALRGVFKPSSVSEAQAEGVYLYWWHRIDALGEFLRAAKP